MLRRTLASWTAMPAASIALECGQNGDPAMRDGQACNALHPEGTLPIGVADRRQRLRVDGLSIALQSFTGSPERTGNVLEALDGDAFGAGSESWNVCSVPLAGRHAAAVAIDSRDCEVSWSPVLQ